MFEMFRSNILELLSWTDVKFDLFSTLWEKELHNNIGKNRPPLIYSKDYMESILSLFFVIRQQDLNLGTYFVNEKSIFFTLICFYLVEDLRLQQQSELSIKGTTVFLNSLEENKLISKKDINLVLGLLHAFSEQTVDVINMADDVVSKDLSLVRDILFYNDPVVVFSRACMFYYGEPKKVIFKYLPEDLNKLTPELFFDNCFQKSLKIHNTFIKQLFVLNYHLLMEVQGRDKIFPF